MSTATQAAVEGGLADPVFGSQAIFRAAMDAFAGPGRVVDFGAHVSPPSGLVPAAAAFLAAMADLDTPIWLNDAAKADTAVAGWLAFQTGAPIAPHPADAVFAVLEAGQPTGSWDGFSRGTPDYPDRSATLLLPVEDFENGARLQLLGPGIETTAEIAPLGLPVGFLTAMTANHTAFPLGLDVLLVCGTKAVALPRTTRIREV